MSEVILEFIKPYLDSAKSLGAYESLIGVGILAWNAALLPATARRKLLSDAMAEAFSPQEWDVRHDLLDLLDLLIQRKERFFAENRRFIMRYHLSRVSEGYQLSVVSTDSQSPERES